MWCSHIEITCCKATKLGRKWKQSQNDPVLSLSKKGKSYKNHGHYRYNHRKGSAGKSKPNSKVPPPSGEPKESPPPPPPPPVKSCSNVFNVIDFGAKGDGIKDDTKAFQAAWAAACKAEASSIIVPAEYVFLVGPISFSGPYCQHNIVFQLDGTIVAPTGSAHWGSGLLQWLEFTKLVGLTIRGSGTIDGNGAVWWNNSPYDDDPLDDQSKIIFPSNWTFSKKPPVPVRSSLGAKMPSIKPTALRFYGSFNVTVTGIRIQNSPQCHLKFDNCIGVSVYDFTVSSPGDSPNTDGIHLQNSKDVLIRSSSLACGDIGGLGKDNTKACVSNVTVRDIIMHNTMNGVRIKTWQGGSGSVQGVQFLNIQVSEVQLPIVIDQYYCDKAACKNQTSAVALSGINYVDIRGTYTVKPVHFACSDHAPCTDVTLTGIQLRPQLDRYRMYDPFCWRAFGKLYSPTVPPVECLMAGKPSSSNKIQGDGDYC
ncbi:Pectin lyase-like superfamily protein [Striga hermonthica]|uniref:Pectin lyase-like superfamily protein n=1 Tax=Striga hermonthica TaxID=68872 RepID=A0A9N7MYQ4_STRHE|nr:Pectin lyase-like superfamily protein [Striga hermonthica]